MQFSSVDNNVPTLRTLYVLRHCKSSWDDESINDIDRPLNKRGERDAQRLAEHFRDEGIGPEWVLCSPAVRARATLAMVAATLPKKHSVSIDDGLYGATAAELRAIVTQIPDSVSAALVIGHNPGLANLVCELADDQLDFPTAALATFEMKDWTGAKAALRALVTPKHLERQ